MVSNMKINEFNCISEHNNIDEYLEFYKYVKSNMKEPSWLGEFSLNELKIFLIMRVNYLTFMIIT